jgi:hypothetical protein
MNVKNQEALIDAEFLVDSLTTLAMKYQIFVSSAEQGADSRAASEKRRFLSREELTRHTIDKLRERGLAEAANGVEDLWKAAAMVFNLGAVSIGVDEVEVLDIDIEGPSRAAVNALKRASKQ